jgi:gliding motility-associated-like protein
MPDSSISDKVSYQDDWHFSIVKDFKGKSLERLDYNRTSQDEGNWHTAAQIEGWATPGKENSQYFPNQLTEEAVSTYPEVFSPDNDGFEDVLNIAFNVNEPGYVCNITIFDREGRIVKNLVQNQLIGIEGTFTWDGTTNKLERARIGVYIIYFEVFNLTGDVSVVKKAVVLGGKL